MGIETDIDTEIKGSSVPFFIKPITNGIANKITESFVTPSSYSKYHLDCLGRASRLYTNHQTDLKTHYSFLEGQLATSGGKYLCGPNLTGADIILSFPLIAGHKRTGVTSATYPKLLAYIELLENEPGYKKAVEKIIEIDGKFEVTV